MKRFLIILTFGLIPFIIFSQVKVNNQITNRNKNQQINVSTLKNSAVVAPKAFFTANLPDRINIDKFVKIQVTINPRGIGTYGALILPDNQQFVYHNFVLPYNARIYRLNNAYYIVWSPIPQNPLKVTFDFKVKKSSNVAIPKKINLNYVFAFFKNTRPGQAVIRKTYNLEYAYIAEK